MSSTVLEASSPVQTDSGRRLSQQITALSVRTRYNAAVAPAQVVRESATAVSDVTHILSQIESGDPAAAHQLLPLVYDELRKLAAAKLAHEKPGQTLQATALVHEAYMQLVDQDQGWDSRGHFFAAAAEAMRRILIQSARRKHAQKRGGGMDRWEIADADLAADSAPLDILVLSEALDLLSAEDPTAASLAKLRIFAGLSVDEAGSALRLSHTSAYRQWTYAQAWLRAKLRDVP